MSDMQAPTVESGPVAIDFPDPAHQPFPEFQFSLATAQSDTGFPLPPLDLPPFPMTENRHDGPNPPAESGNPERVIIGDSGSGPNLLLATGIGMVAVGAADSLTFVGAPVGVPLMVGGLLLTGIAGLGILLSETSERPLAEEGSSPIPGGDIEGMTEDQIRDLPDGVISHVDEGDNLTDPTRAIIEELMWERGIQRNPVEN